MFPIGSVVIIVSFVCDQCHKVKIDWKHDLEGKRFRVLGWEFGHFVDLRKKYGPIKDIKNKNFYLVFK